MLSDEPNFVTLTFTHYYSCNPSFPINSGSNTTPPALCIYVYVHIVCCCFMAHEGNVSNDGLHDKFQTLGQLGGDDINFDFNDELFGNEIKSRLKSIAAESIEMGSTG